MPFAVSRIPIRKLDVPACERESARRRAGQGGGAIFPEEYYPVKPRDTCSLSACSRPLKFSTSALAIGGDEQLLGLKIGMNDSFIVRCRQSAADLQSRILGWFKVAAARAS